MTPTDLQSWRKQLGLSKTRAAELLGLSYSTFRYYEAGRRDGHPVEIPHTVALACAAVAFDLPPWRP